MKAFVLARVSDKKQDSNEAQVDRLNSYIKLKEFNPVVIRQIQESSTKADRKQFYEIIDQIKKENDCVAFVVDTIDRMQRSFKESVILEDLRKEGKVEIHFYRENLVLNKNSSSADLIRWDMGVMFARSYVLQLSDNVKRKRDYMLSVGKLPGKAPYGYKNIRTKDDKGDVEVDEFASKIVVKMFEWYASGTFSLLSIRQKLKRDYGQEFSNGHIDAILKNPFYYGEILSKGKLYPHIYPKLISKELFDRVQQTKASHNKKHFKFAGLPYVYRGLIRCSKCGCMITPEKTKAKYVYYHCTNYHKKHAKSEVEWLREEELTEQFSELFKKLKIPKEVLEEIMDSLKSVHQGKSEFREQQYKKLTQEKDKFSKRIEKIYLDKIDGCITVNEYDKLHSEFRQKIEEIDSRLLGLQKAEDDYYLTAGYLLELANRAYELFVSSEMEQKRQLVKLVLQNLKLEGRKIRYEAISPFDTILNYSDNQLWLLNLDYSGTNKWVEMKRDLGVTEDLDNLFDQVWKKYRPRVCIDCDVDTIIPELERATGIKIPENYSMLEDFVNRFDVNHSIWPVAQKAKQKYKVGLLTNQYPRMLSKIKEQNNIPDVGWDAVVDSSIVGFQKPEEEIYEIAEQMADVNPSNIFFVDNGEGHIEVAKKRGWRTLLYNPQEAEISSQELARILHLN